MNSSIVSIGAGGLFLGALLVARGRLLNLRRVEDLALGVATALLVAMLLAREAAPGSVREGPLSRAYARWGDVVAGLSYTLYAAHYPVVAFLQAWLVGRTRWAPDLAHTSFALLIGAGIIVLYAYPLARITEARTDDVRRFLERRSLRTATSQ